jgi:DNA-directed RNA polymerase subunit RPC12/RpoP
MRVIEQKQAPVKETRKTCHKCKTKLAYTADDVKQDRDGKYIECPSCAAFIGVG